METETGHLVTRPAVTARAAEATAVALAATPCEMMYGAVLMLKGVPEVMLASASMNPGPAVDPVLFA